jgi:hypothetical protein
MGNVVSYPFQLSSVIFAQGGSKMSMSTRQSTSRTDWLVENRFGLFIHWGLCSLLGGENRSNSESGSATRTTTGSHVFGKELARVTTVWNSPAHPNCRGISRATVVLQEMVALRRSGSAQPDPAVDHLLAVSSREDTVDEVSRRRAASRRGDGDPRVLNRVAFQIQGHGPAKCRAVL